MPDSFNKSFEQLLGSKPFPWQEALYSLFSSGAFPSSCNIPTIDSAMADVQVFVNRACFSVALCQQGAI
jgi:hypothetical protein